MVCIVMKVSALVSSFVFCLTVPALFTDTLYLKNGNVLTGNLGSVDIHLIQIQAPTK